MQDGTREEMAHRRLLVADLVRLENGYLACLGCGGVGGGHPVIGDREGALQACSVCDGDCVAGCEYCGDAATDAITNEQGEVEAVVCAFCKQAQGQEVAA